MPLKLEKWPEKMKNAIFGYHRSQYRYHIRSFLLKRGFSMADVGRQIGVSRETVSATISGKAHCKLVLDFLANLGLPHKYLCDPNQ